MKSKQSQLVLQYAKEEINKYKKLLNNIKNINKEHEIKLQKAKNDIEYYAFEITDNNKLRDYYMDLLAFHEKIVTEE